MANLYVIKCGGNFVMQSKWVTPLLEIVKELLEKNASFVIIHGGGIQADNLSHQLKIPIKKINGRRITNFETLQIIKMIYAGLINTDLVSSCISYKIPAVGISGVSNKIAEVVRRPKIRVKNTATGIIENVDFGHVGDIKKINIELLQLLLNNGYVPVVSCLGVDTAGQVLNINADGLAASVATALRAKKLIYVSDIQGVAQDKGKVKFLRHLSFDKARKLIAKGVIAEGMIPKIENSFAVLERNVEYVQIVGPLKTKIDWRDAILSEKFGTIIAREGNNQ